MKKGIKIGLETHGDLINKGKKSVELIKRIGRENVGINYDPCNALLANRGNISIAEDASIICQSGYLFHIHVKDLSFEKNNQILFKGIGKGMVDWPGVAKQIKKFGFSGPMSIKLELNLYGAPDNLAFGQRRPLEEISQELVDTASYLEGLLQ